MASRFTPYLAWPFVCVLMGCVTGGHAPLQALDRLTFGPRPGEVDSVGRVGIKRWIDAQLHPERISDAATDRVLARFPAESMPTANLARIYVLPQELRSQRTKYPSPPDSAQRHDDSVALKQADAASNKILTDLQASRVARAEVSQRQLLEVMTDFWENHFSIYSGKGPERYLLVDFDRDVVRPHALGKFRDLLGAVAHSPAMLYYLDNWDSGAEPTRPLLVGNARRKGHGLNENYGRELLELHTLGVDGGYTQQDVIERRASVHRVDNLRSRARWPVRVPSGVARRRAEDGVGPRFARWTGARGWRDRARHRRPASGNGSLYLDKADTAVRLGHATTGSRVARGRDVQANRWRYT